MRLLRTADTIRRLPLLLAMPFFAAAPVRADRIDGMIFPAPKASYDAKLKGFEKLVPSSGKEVAAVWLPKSGAKTAILYLHGNGEDLGMIAKTLADYRDAYGASVMGVDYPGYGLSAGPASEKGAYAAVDAALASLKSKYGFASDRVVLIGRSLGTGVATDVASRVPVKGLVLVSPFKSAFRVVFDQPGPIAGDRFDSLAKIGAATCQLLVIHGEKDEVIPFAQGKALFEAAAAAKPKTFIAVPEGRHNTGIPGSKSSEFRKALKAIVDAKS